MPVVSAVQMLDWLDGRNDSSFGDLSFQRPAAVQRPRRRVARPGGDDPGHGRDRRPVPAHAQRHARAGDPAHRQGRRLRACSTPPRAATWRPTARARTRRPTPRSARRRSAATAPPSRSPPTSPAHSSSAASTQAPSTRATARPPHRPARRLAHARVRAIDLAGNVDPTPASTSFVTAGTPVQDTTPPDTTIAGATVTGSHARLTFSSNDAGAHFQCQLDGAAFAACTSPVDYNGLADGAHTFRARAIDAAGNVDPTPATRPSPRWSADRRLARPLRAAARRSRAAAKGRRWAPQRRSIARPHG